MRYDCAFIVKKLWRPYNFICLYGDDWKRTYLNTIFLPQISFLNSALLAYQLTILLFLLVWTVVKDRFHDNTLTFLIQFTLVNSNFFLATAQLCQYVQIKSCIPDRLCTGVCKAHCTDYYLYKAPHAQSVCVVCPVFWNLITFVSAIITNLSTRVVTLFVMANFTWLL